MIDSETKEYLDSLKENDRSTEVLNNVGEVVVNRGLGLLCHLMKNLGLNQLAIPFPLMYESNAKTHFSLEVLTQEKMVVLYRTDQEGKLPSLDQSEQTPMLNQDEGPYPHYRVAPLIEFLAFLHREENEENIDVDFKNKTLKLVKKFMHKEGLRVGEMIEEVTNNVTRH